MSAEQQQVGGESDAAKKAEAVKVLGEILERMGLAGTYDVKDGADGSISIAMTLNGELPGAATGKRSHVVDSIQFLINKIVNRTPQSRRWISLGLGEHPAPRQPKPAAPAQPAPAPAPAAAPAAPGTPPAPAARQAAPPVGQPARQEARPTKPAARREVDEAALDVAVDEALAAAAKDLAQKAARHGRFVALVGMSADDRARVLKAVKDVPGVSVRVEGEGRNRRLALHPEKPTPMPKQNLPDYDDEDEDGDE